MQKAPSEREYQQWLTELRAHLRGVNLTHLATASGISRTTLWRVRQGRTVPDYGTYNDIIDGLRVLKE